MTPLVFAFPDCAGPAAEFAAKAGFEQGQWRLHHFPDGESLVQIISDISGRDVWLYGSLNAPDSKAMALMFFARTARELGARRVGLVAPYLGYMRQDKSFHDGEAVTSRHFAEFLSGLFDRLVTIDPHLHRYDSLSEIYTIEATLLHAAGPIAQWIKDHIPRPVLIGPDEESRQWVADVAARAGADFTVLEKHRRGDRDVEVSVPESQRFEGHTPVLVDDIISTAHTMVQTVGHMHRAGLSAPVCIGVHGLFAGDGYEVLRAAGVDRIITCNSVVHETNGIDITGLLAGSI